MYRVIRFVRPGGERACQIVTADTGMPELLANHYLFTQYRDVGKAANTIVNRARDLCVFLTFLEGRKINLVSRIEQDEGLKKDEIHAFRVYSQKIAENMAEVVNLRGHSLNETLVGSSTQFNRMSEAASYIDWMSHEFPSVTGKKKAVEATVKAIRKSTPAVRVTDKEPPGLDDDQLLLVQEIASPESELNPFGEPDIRKRNWLIVQLLVCYPLRLGELLNLKTTDIDREGFRQYLDVVRRADDPEDDRTTEPTLKTRSRKYELSPSISAEINDYLQLRKQFGGIEAKKHTYLFVVHRNGRSSRQGRPLTVQSVQSALKKLEVAARAEAAKRGLETPLISAHKFRHTWNNRAVKKAYESGNLDWDQTEKDLRWMNGWSENSSMLELYTRKYTRKKAGESALEQYEEIKKIRGEATRSEK